MMRMGTNGANGVERFPIRGIRPFAGFANHGRGSEG